MKRTLLLFLIFNAIVLESYAQNIGGIGAQLFLDTAGGHTMPRIQGLVPNTAADQNLKATDYIIKVNGISCRDKTMDEVVGMIRGEIGTSVHIVVADTKEGKRPREYDLVRGGISLPGNNAQPPADPATAFNDACEMEVKQMKKKHIEVVSTFNSECGNFFFNFNAESGPYHIRVMTMEEKGKSPYTPGFSASARVFEGDNEAGATQLTKLESKDAGAYVTGLLEGTVTIKKESVATIGLTFHDDVKKCRGLYIIVYK